MGSKTTATVLIAASLGVASFWASAAQGQTAACVQPPSNMVSWWTADGDARDTADGNNGTLNGNATFAPGKVHQAFSFDGAGDFVEVADAPNLDITTAITIDAWINPSNLGTRIVDKITAGGADGYLLDTFPSNVRLVIGAVLLTGGTNLPTGTFTHVAGTYDGTTMHVYVNGNLDGTLAGPASIPTNNLPLRIGIDQQGNNAFSGLIDEVEIFNRALSQSEIQAIVNAGPSGKCRSTAARVPALSWLGLAALALILVACAPAALRRTTTRA